ncbi:DUF7527 domain-containing protein [Halorubrum sp. HHNYT27]|uniref:DUF7527 domain-containing protein n=1 Tax=Halorubrum sp. HHNYT27 TaxID=3402275 RepID=UPI003EB8996E
MDAQRRSEITEWDAREFSDGFADLGRLVDRGFSGAATDGMGWLFVFEGRVVGTADAELDDFAEASGTLYESPEAVLPVLFAMQEQGVEPRAQYYTNDTPLSEADRKLSQGGFTGYIELSENVLSGDYYVTYTAGESMSAAYVGNSRRLETGDKAFSLADDEVGIYTVYEVDLTVREIPSDAGGTASASAAADPSDEESDDDAEEDGPASAGVVSDDRSDPTSQPDDDEHATTDDDAEPADPTVDGSVVEAAEAAVRESEATADPEADAADDESPSPVRIDSSDTDDVDDEPREGSDAPPGTATPRDNPAASAGNGDEAPSDSTVRTDESPANDSSDGEVRPSDDVFSEEEQWREQRSIPALDPSEASDPPSARNGDAKASGRASQRTRSTDAGAGREATNERTAPANEQSPRPRSTGKDDSNQSAVSQRSQRSGGAGGDGRERLQKLKQALNESERERTELEAELETVVAERDEVAADRDELAGEVDRLETEMASLREERDRLREELAGVRERLPESDRTISPAEARSGTNLFVRYESKGGATLEDAHDGSVGRDELRENLRIEHHTSFETDGLAVDGRPFEEFLRETIEYGFTQWIVEDLPFEVSGTGNQSVLRDLYDAIPEIDRAEIGGSVSIMIRENGEETREQRTFDLVLRDRMGNPLFVADLNDSRDPTAEGALESLVGNGRDIAESNDSFAGAFAVTESFFEPGALETASDAVGGGLFSRSKRSSFVKLSRKQGYHLCLIEARDGGFHMTVPDL